jgi:hypothetical protein
MRILVRLVRAIPNEVNECIDRTIGHGLVILWKVTIGTVNAILFCAALCYDLAPKYQQIIPVRTASSVLGSIFKSSPS